MKKSVDVSSFLLVEATGDSEVDSDPNMTIIDLVDDDDGDAESCSCDTSYHSCVNGVYSEVEEYHVNYNVVDEEQHQHQQQQQQEEEEGRRRKRRSATSVSSAIAPFRVQNIARVMNGPTPRSDLSSV